MTRLRLNRRLELESAETVSDGAGGFDRNWVHLGSVWGAITARGGRFASGSGGPVSTTSVKVIVRAAAEGHSNRPRPGQRFREGSRLFRIEAVHTADSRALYLACQCQEEIAP